MTGRETTAIALKIFSLYSLACMGYSFLPLLPRPFGYLDCILSNGFHGILVNLLESSFLTASVVQGILYCITAFCLWLSANAILRKSEKIESEESVADSFERLEIQSFRVLAVFCLIQNLDLIQDLSLSSTSPVLGRDESGYLSVYGIAGFVMILIAVLIAVKPEMFAKGLNKIINV